MKLDQIDDGRAFDWGRTSDDYAKYRDIYPESYFRTLESLGFAGKGQSVLDMGTGTGVITRRICRSDLKITGIDPEINQIRKAEELSADRDLRFFCRPAEDTGLEPHSFDSIIAAQCYIYFDQSRVMGEIDRLLKPNGRFFITWFCWLPRESALAEASEKLILKYNPHWKGADFQDDYEIQFDSGDFSLEKQIRYKENISFSRESWAGRIRATRGVGAVLDGKELSSFDLEHKALLSGFSPKEFQIPHLVIINSYRREHHFR